MHPGHHRPANLEPRGDRKVVRDQDLNNPHGATFTLHRQRRPEPSLLGNSGKPVTLETSCLTKFLRYVFQGQGTCDFQESWTCEASEARTRDFQESWTYEASESRTRDFQESWTCEALEAQTRDF
jgi:hypothetical protein